MLPQQDTEYLLERAPGHTVSTEAGSICVVIPNYQLPAGFNRQTSTLLLRLSPGYPDVQPDMWWFNPALSRIDGSTIQATDATEAHLGQKWQRWSRHLPNGVWRSGIDGLQNYMALLHKELCIAAAIRVAA